MFYSIAYKNEYGTNSVLAEAESADIAKADFLARSPNEFVCIWERPDFVPVPNVANKKPSKEYQINLTSEEMVVVLNVLSRAADDFQGYINEQEDALNETIVMMNEEAADESRREHCIGGCQLNLERLINEKKEYEEVGAKIEKLYFDNCEYKPYFALIPRKFN